MDRRLRRYVEPLLRQELVSQSKRESLRDLRPGRWLDHQADQRHSACRQCWTGGSPLHRTTPFIPLGHYRQRRHRLPPVQRPHDSALDGVELRIPGMSFRHWRAFLLATSTLVACGKGASNQVAMSAAKKADVKAFDEALDDYFSGNPKSAAPKLYAFLESTPPTDENYGWAQFFLAKSLIDLRLRHAGNLFLARIAHERGNPAALIRALEELQVAT